MTAPSGPVDVERVQRGTAILSGWGLTVRFGRHALDTHDQLRYLSATDHTRAEDFTRAWTDPDTSAVWAARGGYGAQRMVDQIDFAALRAAGPKHFLGFSDITALHARIGREVGQVTIHGPVAGSLDQLSDPDTVGQLRKLMMEPPRPGHLLCRGTAAVDGRADGVLMGGNLSLMAADVGVERPPTQPSIMVIEDIDERGYRVDRMLTQLQRGDWFAAVVGFIIGSFSDPDDADLVDRVVLDRLTGLGVPMITGVAVGHGGRNLPLPLGAVGRLESCAAARSGTLTLV